MHSVPAATKSLQKQNVDLVHVVATDVEMKPMSPTSTMENKTVKQEAAQKNAMRIADKSHEFILGEMRRRKRLECDPSKVFVAADEGSEDDEDDED